MKHWGDTAWVRTFVDDCVAAVVRDESSWEVLRTSVRLRELLSLWMRLDVREVRLKTAPLFLFLASGWLLALLATAWQLRGGALRRTAARRRCAGMPTTLEEALTRPRRQGSGEQVRAWLLAQVDLTTGRTQDAACAYDLSGVSYVGVAAQAGGTAGRSRLGLPAIRASQHLRSIARRDIANSLHRIALIEREHPGSLHIFAAASGKTEEMRALESALIHMVCPQANTVFATRRGWASRGGAPAATPPSRSPPASLAFCLARMLHGGGHAATALGWVVAELARPPGGTHTGPHVALSRTAD